LDSFMVASGRGVGVTVGTVEAVEGVGVGEGPGVAARAVEMAKKAIASRTVVVFISETWILWDTGCPMGFLRLSCGPTSMDS
jgi:hypothetical protein